MACAPFAQECLSATCFLKLGSDHLCVIQLFLFSNSRITLSWLWSFHDIFATKWKIIFKRPFWRYYGAQKFPQGKYFISLKAWKKIFSVDLQAMTASRKWWFVGIYKTGMWHFSHSIKTFSKSTLFITNHVSFLFAQFYHVLLYLCLIILCLMSLSMKAHLKWETFKDTHFLYSWSILFSYASLSIGTEPSTFAKHSQHITQCICQDIHLNPIDWSETSAL